MGEMRPRRHNRRRSNASVEKSKVRKDFIRFLVGEFHLVVDNSLVTTTKAAKRPNCMTQIAC